MLKFSRLILCVLVLVAFFYKTVYSALQTENDISNGNWKPNHKTELNLHDFINLIRDEDGDSGGHWLKLSNQLRFIRPLYRDATSLSSASSSSASGETQNEILPDELFNLPLNQLDFDKLDKTPWMKYLIIRNEKKRNREFNPRLGRRSIDDCVEVQRSRPPFAPRLGKKSATNFTPRLGRSVCSDYVEKQ